MDEEIRELLRQEQAEILQRDKEMEAKGFTHRVTWWNHHTRGDDVQADIYFACHPLTLTHEDGEAWDAWKRIQGESTTAGQGADYQIIALAAPKPTDACPTCGANEWMMNKTHGTWWCLSCGSVKDGEQSKLL